MRAAPPRAERDGNATNTPQARPASRGPGPAIGGTVRNFIGMAAAAAFGLLAASAQANNGNGFGRCEEGFTDGTVVRTESRGNLPIGQVRVSDRVWSLDEASGKQGWSRILRRVEAGQHYKLLSEFSAPGSNAVTQACWRIPRRS